MDVQDQEPLDPTMASSSLCGGGYPASLDQQENLPVAYHVSYRKRNECPVYASVSSEQPVCSPSTAYADHRAQGISCLPGMVTIPNANLVGILRAQIGLNLLQDLSLHLRMNMDVQQPHDQGSSPGKSEDNCNWVPS